MLRFLRPKDPRAELMRALGDFQLPAFPASVLQALAVVRDLDAPQAGITETLSLDPGLSARVLTHVNSPAFGSRREVSSLRHAVAMLGRGPLESILVAVGVGRVVPKRAARGFDPQVFWAAASRRAAIAGELAGALHPGTRAESVTAALLQDMALPFLANHGPAEYEAILRSTGGGSPRLPRRERSAFGWDHAEVGGWLCGAWHFPEFLTAGIGGHHGADEGAPAAIQLVGLLDDSHSAAEGIDALVAQAEGQWGLAPDRTMALVNKAVEEADRAA